MLSKIPKYEGMRRLSILIGITGVLVSLPRISNQIHDVIYQLLIPKYIELNYTQLYKKAAIGYVRKPEYVPLDINGRHTFIDLSTLPDQPIPKYEDYEALDPYLKVKIDALAIESDYYNYNYIIIGLVLYSIYLTLAFSLYMYGSRVMYIIMFWIYDGFKK